MRYWWLLKIYLSEIVSETQTDVVKAQNKHFLKSINNHNSLNDIKSVNIPSNPNEKIDSFDKDKYKTNSNDTLYSYVHPIITLIISGLFDRSFFITTLMAIKYCKYIVLLSSTAALSILGVVAVYLGIVINQYISMNLIESRI